MKLLSSSHLCKTLFLGALLGIYPLHLISFECPGHPRGIDEVDQEEKEQRRERDPVKDLGDESQQDGYRRGKGDWA